MFEKEIVKRVLGISIVAALLVLAGMPAAFAPVPGETNAPGIEGPKGVGGSLVCFKVVWRTPTSYTDNTRWTNVMQGTKAAGGSIPYYAWSDCIYALLGRGSTVTMTVTDIAYVGDYYQVWYTTDPYLTAGWTPLPLTTPKVHTGPQLVAPTYLALWDGTGITGSAWSWKSPTEDGVTYYLRVWNNHFSVMNNKLSGPCGMSAQQLLTNGCDKTGIHVASDWSPGGFTISFAW